MTLSPIALEVCVDSPAGLAAAVTGGADRIELCAALALGGLTPSAGLMRLAAASAVPVMAMIRPRTGGFVWSESEIGCMIDEIACAADCGLQGVVIGAADSRGHLDRNTLERLIRAAAGLDITVHRAIDLCPEPVAAMHLLRDLGIRRVLSSGGAATVAAGIARLRTMQEAAPEVSVMPGSGVSPAVLPALRAALPALREVHASCAEALPADPVLTRFGFAAASERQTSSRQVAALRKALAAGTGVGL